MRDRMKQKQAVPADPLDPLDPKALASLAADHEGAELDQKNL